MLNDHRYGSLSSWGNHLWRRNLCASTCRTQPDWFLGSLKTSGHLFVGSDQSATMNSALEHLQLITIIPTHGCHKLCRSELSSSSFYVLAYMRGSQTIWPRALLFRTLVQLTYSFKNSWRAQSLNYPSLTGFARQPCDWLNAGHERW